MKYFTSLLFEQCFHVSYFFLTIKDYIVSAQRNTIHFLYEVEGIGLYVAIKLLSPYNN
jgi:hypothetical protein